MCRTTDYPHDYRMRRFRSRRHDCSSDFKINAFFLSISADFIPTDAFPDSLTLLFLPRINDTALHIHGFPVRPDSPAFVSLHRQINSDLTFATTEPVLAGDGLQFEVYLREAKLLKGLFRKNDAHVWTLECTCELLHSDFMAFPGLSEAQLCVDLDGSQTMTKKVGLKPKRRTNKTRKCRNVNLKAMGIDLVEIPELSDEYTAEEVVEEEVVEEEYDACSSDPTFSSSQDQSPSHCTYSGSGGLVANSELQSLDPIMVTPSPQTDFQGVGWALDLGIWAMCVGVGFFLSRASVHSIKRKRLFS